jgi:hypothetical protein
MDYLPGSFVAGGAVTGVALLGVAVVAIPPRRRRRGASRVV